MNNACIRHLQICSGATDLAYGAWSVPGVAWKLLVYVRARSHGADLLPSEGSNIHAKIAIRSYGRECCNWVPDVLFSLSNHHSYLISQWKEKRRCDLIRPV